MNTVQTYLKSRENFNTTALTKPNRNEDEWETRRKVDTITTKNLEHQTRRQVVLNDGRVIQEDAPNVIVNTIEDHQTHEDSGDEARMHLNDTDWRASSLRGQNVLGEKYEKNVHTHDIQQRSQTTAAANNIGELTHTDVDKVIKYGRDVKSLARPFQDKENNALVIPARQIHHDSQHKRSVDTEEAREITRMHNGRVLTDRYVTHEVVQDDRDQTPDDGTSTEEEYRDGDARGYSHRKEDRYVDYYKVPKGRPISEGKLFRHGVHLASEDKTSRPIDAWPKRSRHHALQYEDHSDSTTNYSETRPPRPMRPSSRSRGSHSSVERKGRLPSSERSYPASSHSRRPAHHQERGYHTIERSQRVDQRGPFFKKNKPYESRRIESDNLSQRSKSLSRASHDQPLGSDSIRSDLDSEREGRLKRAMSFNSSKSLDRNRRESSSKSLLDSVKSLYSSIKKSGKKKKSNKATRPESASKDWFDRGSTGSSTPTRPPRRHRLSSQGSSHYREPSRAPEGSQYTDNSSGRHWQTYSASTGTSRHQSPHSTLTKPQPKPRYRGYGGSSVNLSSQQQQPANGTTYNKTSSVVTRSHPSDSLSRRGRTAKVERRKTIASYDDLGENRDPPRFEEHRRRDLSSSRYFGQDDEVDERDRPAPDMRKYLLSGVNLARRQSMTRDPETRPMVKAI